MKLTQTTFIAIEGPDMAGKTFHSDRVAKAFEAKGIPTYRYHLPMYEIESGQRILSYLQGKLQLTPAQVTEAYQVNRTQAFEKINEELKAYDEPVLVIGDRDRVSTSIYQILLLLLSTPSTKKDLEGVAEEFERIGFHALSLSQNPAYHKMIMAMQALHYWDATHVDQTFNTHTFILDINPTLQQQRLATRNKADDTSLDGKGDIHEKNTLLQTLNRIGYLYFGQAPGHRHYSCVGPIASDDDVVNRVEYYLRHVSKVLVKETNLVESFL